jgi:hypothetical protein
MALILGDWIVSSPNGNSENIYQVKNGFINENFERDVSKLGKVIS